jgi:putative transposase
MKNALKAAAKRLGVEIRSMEFGPDHVHLFVTHVKNHSQAKIGGYLKGLTSRLIRRDLWNRVKKYEWGASFWSDGYFSEPVGHLTDAHIEHYITRQQKKHWATPRLKTQKKVVVTQMTLQDYP